MHQVGDMLFVVVAIINGVCSDDLQYVINVLYQLEINNIPVSSQLVIN
jgi:hypothetical protein